MLNISPNLFEAKINLEDSKANYLAEVNDGLGTFPSPAKSARIQKLLAKFEANREAYYKLVEQEANENGVPGFVVMRYMDESYAMPFENFEECNESDSEPDYEANLRDLNVPQRYDPTRGC